MVKKAAAVAVIMDGGPDGFVDPVAEKAKDPAMLVKDNPLTQTARQDEVPNPALFHKNMERLHEDARLSRCPYNGSIYRGIMSTRFGG